MDEIKLILDNEHFHFVLRQYGPEGAKRQAISMCQKQKQKLEITKENLYSVLSTLESDLAGMFS
ncbi:MAG: hypothetical protein LBH43_06480 [Treponema sp.]|jgi:hypothetical protein|nr:hypothetical protein [Treponema sp.]